MSDLPQEEEQAPPPPNYVPALAQLHDAIDDPDAQAAIGEAAAHINNYQQQRAIVDASNQQAQQFGSDLSSFKNDMLGMVSTDPASVHAAMSAVVPVFQMAARSTGHPDADTHADTLIRDTHSELAAAAVTTAAHRDAGFARSLLGTVSSVLSDDHQAQLNGYIDLQDRARQVDNAAQQIQQAKLSDTQSNHSMFQYASSLFNRDTGNVLFPPRWNQAILADNNVTPQDTASLRQLYARLAADGGAEQSDPFLVTGLVRDVSEGGGPPIRDVLAHATSGALTFEHALHLASLSGDKTQDAQQHAAALTGLLDTGRSAIMGDDPISGSRAYARYVNWLLPRYATTGQAGADPDNDAYILKNGIASFMPTANDLVPAVPRANRRPLSEIFHKSIPTDTGGVRG